MEKTKVEYVHHTFNPFLGCQEMDYRCANCFAKDMQEKLGVRWGPNGTRRRTAESTWKKVETWNRRARDAYEAFMDEPATLKDWFETSPPEPPRVLSTLCDWFEEISSDHVVGPDGEPIYHPFANDEWSSDPADWYRVGLDHIRRDAFALIDRCQYLRFLIATKRPQNVGRMWELQTQPVGESGIAVARHRGEPVGGFSIYRPNVWLGYSASDQQTLDAGLSYLVQCEHLAPVLWLSLEPLLGPVNLVDYLTIFCRKGYARPFNQPWVVVGGESGKDRRPCEIDWIRSIVRQCEAVNCPVFVKQDSARKQGQQGRIPDWLWAHKQLPSFYV